VPNSHPNGKNWSFVRTSDVRVHVVAGGVAGDAEYKGRFSQWWRERWRLMLSTRCSRHRSQGRRRRRTRQSLLSLSLAYSSSSSSRFFNKAWPTSEWKWSLARPDLLDLLARIQYTKIENINILHINMQERPSFKYYAYYTNHDHVFAKKESGRHICPSSPRGITVLR